MSRKKPSTAFSDLTRSYLSMLVRFRRNAGVKTGNAVADVATEIGIGPGRGSMLYYGYVDRFGAITEAEWEVVRERAAEMLAREADDLHRRADELRAEIEQLKREQQSEAPWVSGPVSDFGGCQ